MANHRNVLNMQSFSKMGIMQLFEILPHGSEGPTYNLHSITWLAMTWLRKAPPWYWPGYPQIFISPRKIISLHFYFVPSDCAPSATGRTQLYSYFNNYFHSLYTMEWVYITYDFSATTMISIFHTFMLCVHNVLKHHRGLQINRIITDWLTLRVWHSIQKPYKESAQKV